jgi:[acyl-carrier-protein] S-malonyltransferase
VFAFLYPGQGSQQPGMGKFLFENFTIAKTTFEEASDAIGVNLKKLCFEGSVEDLALTENTQPCLLTVSTATTRVLTTEFGVQGRISAGHSIGEYGALVATGVIPFAGSVKAVKTRGQAMQSAVPVGQGGMVAVMGLSELQVQQLCTFVEKNSGQTPLSPANYNSPGQIVISGSMRAIEWMRAEAKAENIWPENTPRLKLIPLTVSAPFHCSMMKPAEDVMRSVLTDMPFQIPEFPVIQNLTAQPVTASTELRENLIRQVSAPVKWMQSMETLKNQGVSQCLELGTGKVLHGLLKKIDSEFFQVLNANTLEDLKMIEKIVLSVRSNSESTGRRN